MFTFHLHLFWSCTWHCRCLARVWMHPIDWWIVEKPKEIINVFNHKTQIECVASVHSFSIKLNSTAAVLQFIIHIRLLDLLFVKRVMSLGDSNLLSTGEYGQTHFNSHERVIGCAWARSSDSFQSHNYVLGLHPLNRLRHTYIQQLFIVMRLIRFLSFGDWHQPM